VEASPLSKLLGCRAAKGTCTDGNDEQYLDGFEGAWYWLRSPEQEKRVVMNLYNRYCIRCHSIDGRGVWDIPDVPDFTNGRWQATRTDAQLARVILEGRGSVMPPWRGTLSLEEAWAMGRHLRSFVPGTETPKPDTSKPGTGPSDAVKPEPKKP
jgi:mono/diheme cytochrome c family protein